MKINEIFYSIQGEGKLTGIPTIFIRTSGCNLRCTFCDTKYAYFDGSNINLKQIFNIVKKYQCKNLCITGGEPLLQEDIQMMINIFLKEKYKISIETNGSINIKSISNIKDLMISLDMKCPSSRMHDKMFFENLNILKKKDQLKFIIKDRRDYNYAKKILKTYNPDCITFFQPVWGSKLSNLANWILKDNINVRLGLQIHKIIWGKKRGV